MSAHDARRNLLGNERGGLFGVALVTALVSSIGAYAVLFATSSGTRLGAVLKERSRARYAAEAGLVIAQAQLLRVPTYCGTPAGSPIWIDTDQTGTGDTPVAITVTPCGSGNENVSKTIEAKVSY